MAFPRRRLCYRRARHEARRRAAQADFCEKVGASLPAAPDGKVTFAASANAARGFVGG
jgi:hypothetical protein